MYRPSQSHRVREFARRIVAGLLVIVVSALLFGPAAEAADGGSGTNGCGPFVDGFELDDGSVIAVSDSCLAKIGPTGIPDPTFGDEGTVTLDIGEDGADGQFVSELLRMPSGYLVATDQVFLKFTGNGEPDETFGPGGRRNAEDLVPFGVNTYDVAAGPGGSFYFSSIQTVGGLGGQTVAKVDSSGHLDESFSDDGIFYSSHDAPDTDFYFHQLALDDSGRLLVAGANYAYVGIKASVIRLTSDGDLDTTFGIGGQAGSTPIDRACLFTCEVRLHAIQPGDDGSFSLLGQANFAFVRVGVTVKTFWAEFDGDGVLQEQAHEFDDPSTPAVFHRLPDGDLLVNRGAGGKIHPDGSDAFPGGRIFDEAKLAPDGFRGDDVSYNPATGNILSVGQVSGYEKTRGAIAKLDATTGEAVPGFGVNGVVMAGPGVCDSGPADRIEGYGPWQRCRTAVPNASVKTAIRHAGSVRPSLRVNVNVARPRTFPMFVNQRVSIRLPGRLPMRSMAMRNYLSVVPKADAPGAFVVRRAGRKVIVDFKPKRIVWDPSVEDRPENAKLTVKMAMARGGLKAIPRRLRGKKLQVWNTTRMSIQAGDDRNWWTPEQRIRKSPVAIPPRG